MIFAGTTPAVAAYFDMKAPTWDHSKPDYDKIRLILQMARLTPSKRILDVACGTGVLLPVLLEYAPEIIHAIDLSPNMVRLAQEKYNHPSLSITAADFYMYDGTGYDYIIVYNAYPHFQDKCRFIQKAHTCLKPGGRLVIAHGNGRAIINSRHSIEPDVQSISVPLKACHEEVACLGERFRFDLVVDTEKLYLLSGINPSL